MKPIGANELLLQHLRRLIRQHKIKHLKDLSRIGRSVTPDSLRVLHRKLSKLSFARKVRLDLCPYSYAGSFLQVRFRGKGLGGVSLHASHIMPIFYEKFVPDEGFVGPITWKMTIEEIRTIDRNYQRALRRPIPKRSRELIDRVLDAAGGHGFLWVPEPELERLPRKKDNIPEPFGCHSLKYLLFHSIPLFD